MINGSTGNIIYNGTDIGTYTTLAVGDFDEDGRRSEIVIAGLTGNVSAYIFNGTLLWNRSDIIGAAYDIQTGDFGNDSYYDDVAVIDNGTSTEMGALLVYNGSGTLIANVSLWNGTDLSVGNLDNKNGEDIVVSLNGQVNAYNGSGYNLWNNTDALGTPYEVRVTNISSEAGDEILVLDSAGYIILINSSGSQKWNYSIGTSGFSMAVGDLDFNSFKDVVVDNGSNIVMFNLSSYVNLWNYSTRGQIGSRYADGALAIGDINGDGRNEVIIASQDNYMYVLANNVQNITDKDESNLTVKWFVKVNVTTPTAPITGASVTAFENSTETFAEEWYAASDVYGLTGWIGTTEYIQNASNTKYYTQHNISAVSGGDTNSTVVRVNESKWVTIMFGAPTSYCN